MQLRRKRFERPAEVRAFELGTIEIVELGDLAVGRATFQPGWRWSEHVAPIAGTAACEVHHLGFVISGHLHVEMKDGASIELVAGDVFEVPPGHDAWVIGDAPWISVDYAGRRLFAKPPHAVTETVLASIVFTDLSRSTETIGQIGDAAWNALLAEHNEAARREIERFSGREIQTTGDGFLVLFDTPAMAVRGAAAMIDAASRLGLTARAAVHAGEVQVLSGEARGLAIHAAARIIELAKPADVLVSGLVRGLLAGQNLAFEDRGQVELRGIEGEVRLAALVR